MLRIYSKINPEKLLHVVYRLKESDKRMDILSEDNPLQVSMCTGYVPGHNFKGAHRHLPQLRTTNTTSESWIVIQGSLKVVMYDIDDSKIDEVIINAGDCYVYLGGGHSLTALEENTVFYEYKNGPYNGQAKDKVFFNA